MTHETYGEMRRARMDLKRLEEIASEQFAKHGLTGWTFQFADTRRLGVCKYAVKRIEISEYYAGNNPDEAVLDTLLHEISHALAGPKAGHGAAWKAIAVRIGRVPVPVTIQPTRSFIPATGRRDVRAATRPIIAISVQDR